MEGVKYKVVSASGSVSLGFSKYWRCIVTAATAPATLLVRNSTTAGSGDIIDAIPVTSAIGYSHLLNCPIDCSTGITFDLNGGTGTITLMYEGNQ